MEKKEKKIHKIHLKDYTNQLEKVLEKKNYSLQTKNLLLSMVYKIENAYPDYQKTKVAVYDKGVFLDILADTIENYCDMIEIAEDENINEEITNEETNEENANNKKRYSLDRKHGRVLALGNEFVLLNAILEMSEEELCMPEEENLLKAPIGNFLHLGRRMHETEVIRDFNGWSWDIVLKDIENIQVNLAFQTFLYLLGYEFIEEWMENESPLADYIILAEEKFKNEFGEEKARELIELFCRISIETYVKQNSSQREIWLKLKEENNYELEKLNNKKVFLEDITMQKKELTKRIEQIDKLLNNNDALQEEYEKRNEKLPNKEKIFSIRHLVNMLEVERQECVDKIRNNNEIIKPEGFVARKEEVSKRAEFLNKLQIEPKQNSNKTLLELCTLFLACFQIKIAKCQTKQEIVSYLYILRYYSFLTFDKNGTKLKEVEKLKESFSKTIDMLLNKARKLLAIEEITDDEDVNKQILCNIFR